MPNEEKVLAVPGATGIQDMKAVLRSMTPRELMTKAAEHIEMLGGDAVLICELEERASSYPDEDGAL